MRVTITAGETAAEVRTVRLTDGRLAGAVPPQLADRLAASDALDVRVATADDDAERPATASLVRSGRAWTEARGRLRDQRGWARRWARSPAEVVLLAVSPGVAEEPGRGSRGA